MAQERRRTGPAPAGPPPDEARLREAALNHLARFAATEVGLRRVLARRVDRWARRAEAEGREVGAEAAAGRAAAAVVAREMVASGAVDDAAFAESRARRLARTGRSRRAALAHLAAKGVSGETAAAAVPASPAVELAAALAYCRRRRIGPFAREAGTTPEARVKALAALARGGFPRDIAERALRMGPAEAEERLIAARQG
jgi:regulatory protein